MTDERGQEDVVKDEEMETNSVSGFSDSVSLNSYIMLLVYIQSICVSPSVASRTFLSQRSNPPEVYTSSSPPKEARCA